MFKKFAGLIVFVALCLFMFNPSVGVDGRFTTSTIDQVQVTSNILNLRSGAGTNHKIVKTLTKGTVLEVLGKIDDWYVVKMENDAVGCVINKYVKSYVGQSPVVTPTPSPTPAPDPTTDSNVDASAMQAEMLGYINAERAKVNLSPLKLDAKLSEGATLKSQDMATNKYFSHDSPTYGSPFDMMRQLGITYSYAGENIAKHMTVKSAHEGFMNSPGHRANILKAEFNKVGLGFVKDGYYLYVTQWFTN